MAETVEKMLSANSDGTELRQFEFDFLTSTSKMGLGNSPFINSLVRLVKEKRVDAKSDLPGFSETLISRKMAPIGREAHKEGSIHGRSNGHDPVRGGSHDSGQGSKEGQSQ
ncbi:MAG: hypothetical protein KA145_07675 [Alicycliphilus sp.]|nr:hypothetical protein [Alicycliphilus sp.]